MLKPQEAQLWLTPREDPLTGINYYVKYLLLCTSHWELLSAFLLAVGGTGKTSVVGVQVRGAIPTG